MSYIFSKEIETEPTQVSFKTVKLSLCVLLAIAAKGGIELSKNIMERSQACADFYNTEEGLEFMNMADFAREQGISDGITVITSSGHECHL